MANTSKESKTKSTSSKKRESEFSTEELKKILSLLQENKVTEFRLVRGGESLFLKRHEDCAPQQVVQHVIERTAEPLPGRQMEFQPATNNASAPSAQAIEPSPVKTPEASNNYKEVTSPMVGTFYRQPSVDAPPYAEVGDKVSKGQVLCIVEAMKVMNEIESSVAGTIVEICLDDSQMVEYGEVLFRVKPN